MADRNSGLDDEALPVHRVVLEPVGGHRFERPRADLELEADQFFGVVRRAPVQLRAADGETRWHVAVEALAEILELELPSVEIPEPRESPIAAAHHHLVTSLRALETGDSNTQHAVRILFRLARHIARFDEIGDATGLADLDDLGDLLGDRPASWQEGEAALERYVQADGGAHDAELVLLFHRRLTRLKALLGPAGSAMARHLPIQPFSKRSEPHTAGAASDPTISS